MEDFADIDLSERIIRAFVFEVNLGGLYTVPLLCGRLVPFEQGGIDSCRHGGSTLGIFREEVV